MDKNNLVHREHSAKEHLVLAVMIVIAFFILTSNYNPEVLPSASLTGAAVVNYGPIAIWGIIMMLLIIGIVIGIILWWRNKKDKVLLFRRENYPFLNHKRIQVQLALQQDVENIVKVAGTGKSSKSVAVVDPLTRKLNRVEQELVDIPIRSAAQGHILKSISPEYEPVPVKPVHSLHHLFHPRVKATKKLPSHHLARHPVKHHFVKHRESFQDKMREIEKEIRKVKTRV